VLYCCYLLQNFYYSCPFWGLFTRAASVQRVSLLLPCASESWWLKWTDGQTDVNIVTLTGADCTGFKTCSENRQTAASAADWRPGNCIYVSVYAFYRATLSYRRASHGPVSVCVRVCDCICHKPVWYQNDWMNQAGIWHGGLLRPILHCVLGKFRYIRKFRYFRLARHEFRHGTSIVAACCQLSSSKQHAYRETPCLHHDSTYTTRLT